MAEKVIIVSGASRGIGLAVSRRLLSIPNISIVVLSRSRTSLETIQNEDPSRVEIIAGDASDFSLGQKAVDAAVTRWGRVDGLVINHGQLEPMQKIADADIEGWRQAFDVNAISAVAMVKAALPELRKTKGCIVLTSSGAAVGGTSTWGCYGAAKAVLNHLALTLSKEEKDVTTIAVRPGVVDTAMQKDLADKYFAVMEREDTERFVKMRAEGKMLKPEQPGDIIALLALKAPLHLSGSFVNWNDEKLSFLHD